MTLTWAEPAGYFEPQGDEHCPECSRCDEPQGHCRDEAWVSGREPGCSPDARPEDPCACPCSRCKDPERARCRDTSEHRLCPFHRSDAGLGGA